MDSCWCYSVKNADVELLVNARDSNRTLTPSTLPLPRQLHRLVPPMAQHIQSSTVPHQDSVNLSTHPLSPILQDPRRRRCNQDNIISLIHPMAKRVHRRGMQCIIHNLRDLCLLQIVRLILPTLGIQYSRDIKDNRHAQDSHLTQDPLDTQDTQVIQVFQVIQAIRAIRAIQVMVSTHRPMLKHDRMSNSTITLCLSPRRHLSIRTILTRPMLILFSLMVGHRLEWVPYRIMLDIHLPLDHIWMAG